MAQLKDMGRAARMRQRAVLEFVNENNSVTVWEVSHHFEKEYDSTKHEAIYYGAMLDLEEIGFLGMHDGVFYITDEAIGLLEEAANKA